IPAALQATGPRKPTSVGIGEKSPSNSRPWASSGSTGVGSVAAGTSVLLTSASETRHPDGRDGPAESCAGVIPSSALHSERYDGLGEVVNDTPIRPEDDHSPSTCP